MGTPFLVAGSESSVSAQEPGKILRKNSCFDANQDGFDANQDGKVTRDEVPEQGKERYSAMLKRAGQEELTKEEFLRQFAAMQGPGNLNRPNPGNQPGPVPELLQKLDTNSDKRISKAELTKAAEKFDELDINQDGQLDPRELFGNPGPQPENPANPRQPRVQSREFRMVASWSGSSPNWTRTATSRFPNKRSEIDRWTNASKPCRNRS